jgi:serine/threonine protein kinase
VLGERHGRAYLGGSWIGETPNSREHSSRGVDLADVLAIGADEGAEGVGATPMTTDDDLGTRAHSRVGSVLGEKYRLDRVLGVGGFASVYAATHRNKSRVAVKVLHRELAIDKSLRDRFLREGYAANSVEHEGVVRVLDDDIDEDGSVFLVMELLDGETLEARWERSKRRLTVPEVAVLIGQLLEVLAAVHAKGITHRDLKNENLFLTRDGRLKLLDFGVARLREASPTRTKSGAVFGTPSFMPPEQALGRINEVDALSDLWAVGATAFALLSGRYVHIGETAEEVLVNAATKPAPPLASIAPHVPAGIAEVIDKALAYEKRDRWPSAKTMSEALALAFSIASRQPLTATSDDWEDGDEQTRLAPPPQMTLPLHTDVRAASPAGFTEAMRTLRVTTIAGMVSESVARHAQTRAMVLSSVAVGGILVAVGVGIVSVAATSRAHRVVASDAASGSASRVPDIGTPPESAHVQDAALAPVAGPSAVAGAPPRRLSVADLPTASRLSTAAPPQSKVLAPVPPTSSARPAALPPNPFCDPPFVIVDGVKKWRRGCF